MEDVRDRAVFELLFYDRLGNESTVIGHISMTKPARAKEDSLAEDKQVFKISIVNLKAVDS